MSHNPLFNSTNTDYIEFDRVVVTPENFREARFFVTSTCRTVQHSAHNISRMLDKAARLISERGADGFYGLVIHQHVLNEGERVRTNRHLLRLRDELNKAKAALPA